MHCNRGEPSLNGGGPAPGKTQALKDQSSINSGEDKRTGTRRQGSLWLREVRSDDRRHHLGWEVVYG